jgi:hypothetical protein
VSTRRDRGPNKDCASEESEKRKAGGKDARSVDEVRRQRETECSAEEVVRR